MQIIKFTASWCQPCKIIQPELDKHIKNVCEKYKIHENLLLNVVDVDDNDVCKEICDKYSITVTSIPHIVLIINEQIKKTVLGVNKKELEELFSILKKEISETKNFEKKN